ncbi:MAG: GNAT family N-acetyltransferase [Mycobacteriales bacterium]
MRELTTAAEVASAAGGDPVIRWAAQGLPPAVRAWADGDAVVVATPALSLRDRLAVLGPVPAVAKLVAAVLPEVGPAYRPFGDETLVRGLADRLPAVRFAAAFGWMDTTGPVPAPASGATRWLADDDAPTVAALLAEAAPDSYARPGIPGVTRWAGRYDDAGTGRLAAVTADAWSSPDVGFLAGVATRPDARGNGYAEDCCRLVAASLLTTRSQVALMVNTGNTPARTLYTRLGFHYRPIAAARFNP